MHLTLPSTSIAIIIIITSSCWRPKSEKKSCAGQPAYCCCRRKARDRRNSRRLHGTGIGTGGKVICTGAQQRHQRTSPPVFQSVTQSAVKSEASIGSDDIRAPRPPHLRFRPLRYKRILSARSGSDHPRPSRHLPWSCPVLSCPAITTTTPPPSFLSSPRHPRRGAYTLRSTQSSPSGVFPHHTLSLIVGALPRPQQLEVEVEDDDEMEGAIKGVPAPVLSASHLFSLHVLLAPPAAGLHRHRASMDMRPAEPTELRPIGAPPISSHAPPSASPHTSLDDPIYSSTTKGSSFTGCHHPAKLTSTSDRRHIPAHAAREQLTVARSEWTHTNSLDLLIISLMLTLVRYTPIGIISLHTPQAHSVSCVYQSASSQKHSSLLDSVCLRRMPRLAELYQSLSASCTSCGRG